MIKDKWSVLKNLGREYTWTREHRLQRYQPKKKKSKLTVRLRHELKKSLYLEAIKSLKKSFHIYS